MATKICPQCNNQFTTKHKHTVHCGVVCAGISKRTHSYEKICEYCKKEYVSKHKEQVFCSNKCSSLSKTKQIIYKCSCCEEEIVRSKEKTTKNVFCNRDCYTEFSKKVIITKQCFNCGKDVSRPKYMFRHDKVFCSNECTSKRDTVLTCKVCNTEFCSIRYRKSNNEKGFSIQRPFRQVCSTKCHYEFYRTNQERKDKISFAFSGEKHPNYVNGCSSNYRVRRTEFKEVFFKKDKIKVLEKFNHSCFNCGSTEKLTIDHHLPFSMGGRLTESNSVVLCLSCNSSKNAKHPNIFYSKKQLNKLKTMGIDSTNIFNFIL